MRYQYNYSFLAKWLEMNKNIQKSAIQTALGAKSNNGFKSWLRGDGAMPVITMLRLCNAFQIPLTSFFCDSEAKDGDCIKRPTPDTQLEPNGGYSNYEERTQGERSALNPVAVEVIPSVIPGIKEQEDKHEDVDKDGQKEIIVGNISDSNMMALIELQNKHAAVEAENNAQRNRFLNIIAEQQKQIADLTNTILRLKETYKNEDYLHYGMVAESDPHL